MFVLQYATDRIPRYKKGETYGYSALNNDFLITFYIYPVIVFR